MPLDYVLKVDFLKKIRTCTKTFDKLTISLISLWKRYLRNELHFGIEEDQNGDQYVTFPENILEELGWLGDLLE